MEQDGRKRRSLASRDRIIAAVISLIDEDQGIPGAEAIAERANVGLRSVFRHFGDMDGLYMAVLERIGGRFTSLVRPYESPDWPGQLRESMQRRLVLYQGILPYRRAAEISRRRSPLLEHGLSALDQMLRGRTEGILPPEIRSNIIWLEQLDLWMSVEAYGRLRDRQHLDHAKASAVMTAALEALLSAAA